MNSYQKLNQAHQKGFGSVVVLSFIFMLGLSAYVGVKLAPSYLEYRLIAQAMDDAVEVDSIETMRSKQIIGLIRTKMGPSATAPDVDLNAITSVFTRGGLKVVKVNYEVVVPMIKNASALLHYTHEATINPYANTAAIVQESQLIAAN